MAAEVIVITVVSLLAVAAGVTVLIIKSIRSKKRKEAEYSFTTKHNIDIKLSSEVSDITPAEIEEWTESVVDFWYDAKGWSKEESYKVLSKVDIFTYDELYLNRAGIKVNGITWPNTYTIEMATIPTNLSDTYRHKDKVKSLFRHEVSHVIAGFVGNVAFDNKTHHDLFAEVGLGA